MNLQRRSTLTEANLTFVRWIDPPNTIVFADDDEPTSLHIYERNENALRVVVYDGESYAFSRLASQDEQTQWLSEVCGVASTEDEESTEDDQ